MRKILFCQLRSLKAKLSCTSRGQGKSINVMALWSLVTYNRSWHSFVSPWLPVSTFLCAISYFWCIFWPRQTSSDNTIGLKGMGLLFIEGAQVKFEGKTRYYLVKQKKRIHTLLVPWGFQRYKCTQNRFLLGIQHKNDHINLDKFICYDFGI